MKFILDFIEKHKAFVKKIIIVIIALTFSAIVNSETISYFINDIFGGCFVSFVDTIPMICILGGAE